jgi:hypothetical protein
VRTDQSSELTSWRLPLFATQALVVFENVVGLEPKNYIGDNMQKVTDVYRIAQYNVACCYSMINQTDAAVDALKAALISGFDDYKYATSPLPSPPLGWAKCRVPSAWVAPKQGPSQTSSRGVTLLPVGESDGVLWVLGTGTPRTAPIRHSLPPTHPRQLPGCARTAGRTRRRLERMQGEP